MTSRMTALAVITLVLAAQAVSASAAEQPTKEQVRREQLRIAVQEICPISGEKLGSMGDPIKVTIGEAKEEVYLCCKGCLKGRIDKEHWATIHNNIAAAQGKCPIMKKGLPKKVKWTVVKGQLVYVCCPPCIKKIQADPKKSLAQVDEYYIAFLEKKSAKEKQRSVR
ncbi:hypothetical protein OAS39_09240 [Pirellulales bacterium]|nr:hypothetical protein [Pirellulales bacterium]